MSRGGDALVEFWWCHNPVLGQVMPKILMLPHCEKYDFAMMLSQCLWSVCPASKELGIVWSWDYDQAVGWEYWVCPDLILDTWFELASLPMLQGQCSESTEKFKVLCFPEWTCIFRRALCGKPAGTST